MRLVESSAAGAERERRLRMYSTYQRRWSDAISLSGRAVGPPRPGMAATTAVTRSRTIARTCAR